MLRTTQSSGLTVEARAPGRDRRDRAIGDLHHGTAGRKPVEQALDQADALLHREIQEGDGGDRRNRTGVDAGPGERLLQIEGVAVDEADAGIVGHEPFEEIRRILDRYELLRRHAPSEDRLGHRTCSRPQFEDRQAGTAIDDTRHAAGGNRRGGNDRADGLRTIDPALEEADFVIELFGKPLLQLEHHYLVPLPAPHGASRCPKPSGRIYAGASAPARTLANICGANKATTFRDG